jgi:hypothetical protein
MTPKDAARGRYEATGRKRHGWGQTLDVAATDIAATLRHHPGDERGAT